jgi:hypothetical protein
MDLRAMFGHATGMSVFSHGRSFFVLPRAIPSMIDAPAVSPYRR